MYNYFLMKFITLHYSNYENKLLHQKNFKQSITIYLQSKLIHLFAIIKLRSYFNTKQLHYIMCNVFSFYSYCVIV